MLPLFVYMALAAFYVSAAPLAIRGPVDFYDPRANGGTLLDKSGTGGEPLNVIISGKSSPEILTSEGFLDYANAIGLSHECLGMHHGVKQKANLGDGNGWVDEREVMRQHFGIPLFGTCVETFVGGNHFRTFVQNGPQANSGALFLATSYEMDLANEHNIVPNGYDLGRDRLVDAAAGTKSSPTTTYETTVQDVYNLMDPGLKGINHGIATDGIVKLLTVTIKGRT